MEDSKEQNQEQALICAVNRTKFSDTHEAMNHILKIPEANCYKAALNVLQYIEATQTATEDLLIHLYSIMNQWNIHTQVTDQMFDSHWEKVQQLIHRRESKNNRIPCIHEALVEEWGPNVEGLFEWFNMPFNFVTWLQNLKNRWFLWKNICDALNKILVRQHNLAMPFQGMSHQGHPTLNNLNKCALLLDKGFAPVSLEEIKAAHCTLNNLGIVIWNLQVQALPDSPFKCLLNHHKRILGLGQPVSFPSVENLLAQALAGNPGSQPQIPHGRATMITNEQAPVPGQEVTHEQPTSHQNHDPPPFPLVEDAHDDTDLGSGPQIGKESLNSEALTIQEIPEWSSLRQGSPDDNSPQDNNNGPQDNKDSVLDDDDKPLDNDDDNGDDGSNDTGDHEDDNVMGAPKRSLVEDSAESLMLKWCCTLGESGWTGQRCHCWNVELKILDKIEKGPLPGYDDIVGILHLVDKRLVDHDALFCPSYLTALASCLHLVCVKDDHCMLVRILLTAQCQDNLSKWVAQCLNWFIAEDVSPGDKHSHTIQEDNKEGSDSDDGPDDKSKSNNDNGDDSTGASNNSDKNPLQDTCLCQQDWAVEIKQMTNQIFTGFSWRKAGPLKIVKELYGGSQSQWCCFKDGWDNTIERALDQFIDMFLKKQGK